MHKTATRLINKSKSGKPLTRLENKYLDCYIAHCSYSREIRKLKESVQRLKRKGAKRQ